MQNTSEQASTKEFLKSVFSYFQFLGRNWQLLLIALLIGNYYDFIKNSYFKKAIDFGAET
jgi:H+/gluconate symporter-like permease